MGVLLFTAPVPGPFSDALVSPRSDGGPRAGGACRSAVTGFPGRRTRSPHRRVTCLDRGIGNGLRPGGRSGRERLAFRDDPRRRRRIAPGRIHRRRDGHDRRTDDGRGPGRFGATDDDAAEDRQCRQAYPDNGRRHDTYGMPASGRRRPAAWEACRIVGGKVTRRRCSVVTPTLFLCDAGFYMTGFLCATAFVTGPSGRVLRPRASSSP